MRRPAERRRVSFAYEDVARENGYHIIAGTDEAGCGCLAGPVVAAAVVLDRAKRIPGIDDSKRLTPPQRERLFERIVQRALAWGTAAVGNDLVDRWNVLRASQEAMRRAVGALASPPDFLLVDGRPLPDAPCPVRVIVHGDALSFSIAAASILAKVTRDRMMEEFDRLYPGYGFAAHKGYPTAEHLDRLRSAGPTPIHRRTFRGVLPAESRQARLPLES